MRAWHAGAGSWAGRGDVNSRSIGIELANAGPLAGFPPFPEPQMVALERLLDAILPRWSIPAGRRHRPLRPGARPQVRPRPEVRLAPPRPRRPRALGRPAAAAGPADWPAFAAAAEAAGYAAPDGDWPVLLAAVRLRWRPWASAPEPEAADLAALEACVDGGRLPT